MAIKYNEMTPEQKKKANLNNKKWKNKNKEKKAEYRRKHYLKNKVKYLEIERIRAYKKLYNITILDYNILLNRQKGVCAICGTDQYRPNNSGKHFAVDHCHTTGKVRGLLCMACNHLLGRYEKHKMKIDQYLKLQDL